jgi:hypothetical protein
MTNGGWDALPQAEGVPSDEVCALSEGVVEGVEEVGGGGGEEVVQVLLQRINVLQEGLQ